MNNYDINSAWAAVVPILRKCSFDDIKNIVGLAGFDMQILKGLGIDDNDWGKGQNPSLLVSEIGDHFLGFTTEKKHRFLNIVIEKILSGEYDYGCGNDRYENLEEKLQSHLSRLGWQLIDNKVLPIEILDLSDLNELDLVAREDLVKATTKFRDGDLNGAILSAYAAVESVIARVYRDKSLSDVNKSKSFQERCNKSLKAAGVFEAIDSQLRVCQKINCTS